MSCRYAPADLGGRPNPPGVVHELMHGGWGNDYSFRPLTGPTPGQQVAAVTTWHDCCISVGDHLATHDRDGTTRLYVVTAVRRPGDPPDMYFLTTEHRRWPKESSWD